MFLSLLDKGRGFCPRPGVYKGFDFVENTLEYTRRCRLKERFFDTESAPLEVPKNLYIRSSWTPPTHRNPALELYCQSMEKEATHFIPSPYLPKDNLTKNERAALKELTSDPSLTVREADKGGRLVIMNTVDYDASMRSMLANPGVYGTLSSDPTHTISNHMTRHINTLLKLEVLTEKLADSILTGDPQCPHFYGLPKIHKSIPPEKRLPPFRGIIASVNGPNTRASRWLDSILNPLVPAYCGDHWCKDTMHLLRELEDLNSKGNINSTSHTLATIDVVDMYNSIPHGDGVAAISDALSLHSQFSVHQIEAIVDLVHFILSNNCFRYEDDYFRQLRGTAMGSPFAPAYANMFMAFLQKNTIYPALPSQPVWLKRYIDDIVALFPVPFDHTAFLLTLNRCHPSIQFTMSSPDTTCPFLDILISVSPSGISSDLYSKPTDAHKYLRPSSSHPKHTFRSIVYSGATRLRRLCSTEGTYALRAEEFSKHLEASGYDPSFVKPILAEVAKKDRKTLLTPSEKPPTSDRVPLVATFHPQMPNATHFHNKHKSILSKSDRMSKVLPHNPIVAMRRPSNLGNFLIKTKPSSLTTRPLHTLPPGFNRCGDKRCQICTPKGNGTPHGIFAASVKSTTTSNSFPVPSPSNCNSSNCIYVVSCSECKTQYVGKTVDPLRARFNNHKTSVRRGDRDKPVAVHFNSPGHNGVTDMRVQVVEVVPFNTDISRRESHWMWNLKCHELNGGLNLEEPYLKKLCLYN